MLPALQFGADLPFSGGVKVADKVAKMLLKCRLWTNLGLKVYWELLHFARISHDFELQALAMSNLIVAFSKSSTSTFLGLQAIPQGPFHQGPRYRWGPCKELYSE